VEVLALQFVEPCQLIFKFIDLAKPTAAIGREELLALALIDS
jgi:hypothetical protein